jgi:pimeloyl-ACP methyl ester carboxylesterase
MNHRFTPRLTLSSQGTLWIGSTPFSGQAMPSWQSRVLAAHTIRREQVGTKDYRLDTDRLSRLAMPTLLVLGGQSTPFYKAATDALHKALPHSRVAILPGQRHEGVITAPNLFLREIMDFLLDSR